MTQEGDEQPDAPVFQPVEIHAETIEEEALAVAALLVQRFPDSPDSLDVMGWTLHSFGDSPAAMKCWEESLELDPLSDVPYFCMGRVALGQGDHQQAAKWFRESLKLNPNSRDARTRLAETLMQLGKAGEVVELLGAIETTDSGSLEHNFSFAEAYLQLEEYAKAEEKLRAFVRMSPTDRDAHYLLATACAKQGKEEQAGQYMEKVERLYDDERKTRQMRHVLRGDAAKGILASIYLLAGQVYQDRGILAEAETHWQKGRAADPADTKARKALADFHQRQGRTAEAVEILEEIRKIEPENVFHCLDLGFAYATTGQFDSAEAAMKEPVERVADWPMGHAMLAQLYLQSNRNLDKAVELARTAVELEPVASNYSLLSSACQRTGDLQAARTAIEKATELDPVNREYQRMRELIRRKP